MGCQWQPLDLTRIGQYNNEILNVRTTSNKVLQRKSILFHGTLNFLNKPLFWLCVTDYKRLPVHTKVMQIEVNLVN